MLILEQLKWWWQKAINTKPYPSFHKDNNNVKVMVNEATNIYIFNPLKIDKVLDDLM